MAIHIENMTTEVSAVEGDMPLSPAQLETLVDLVIKRLEEKQQQEAQLNKSMEVCNSALPSGW